MYYGLYLKRSRNDVGLLALKRNSSFSLRFFWNRSSVISSKLKGFTSPVWDYFIFLSVGDFGGASDESIAGGFGTSRSDSFGLATYPLYSDHFCFFFANELLSSTEFRCVNLKDDLVLVI